MDGQNVALGKGKAGLELADLGVKEVLVLIHDWFDLFYADAHDQILFFMKNKVCFFTLRNISRVFLDVKKDLFEKGNDVDELGAVQIRAVLLVYLENVGQMGVDLVANLAVLDEGMGVALEFPEGLF